MATHNALGKMGEALAAKWLLENGFALLQQNWRHSYYEIDVIASKNNMLYFIEVKTRRNTRFGQPEESVNPRKMRNLMKAGVAYHYQHPKWKRVQYNVLSIMIQPNNTASYFFIEDVYL